MIDELYSKEITCPVCGNCFTTKKVRTSKLRVDKRDSDFLTYYKGENPIKYDIFVCPQCGYSAMDKRFDRVSNEHKELIINNITTKWNKRSYSQKRTISEAIECYKLALYCGQLLEFNKIELARICLRLSWFYRIKKQFKEEMRFMKYSVDLYIYAYTNENLAHEKMDDITLGYLIGELYRRLGNYKESVSWFGAVVSNRNIKSKPMIEKLTRDQWYLAKEELKGA